MGHTAAPAEGDADERQGGGEMGQGGGHDEAGGSLAPLQGTGRLPPAVSPTACERRQCRRARSIWVTAVCPLRLPAGYHPVLNRWPLGWGGTRFRPAAPRGTEPLAGRRPPPPAVGAAGTPSPVSPAQRTRPELPLPVRLPATTGDGPDGGNRAASIPRGRRHGPERETRHGGRSRPRRKPETFFHQGRGKVFSAGNTRPECRHPPS